MEPRAIDLSTLKFADGQGGGVLVEWKEDGRPKQMEIHGGIARILKSVVDRLDKLAEEHGEKL